MTEKEHAILKREFAKRIHVTPIGRETYSVSARQYVGNIVLPQHTFVIRPKIPHLNFFKMLFLTRDLVPEFNEREFQYQKHHGIYEIMVRQFLREAEEIIRRGISQGYTDNEENLSCVKGRVLLRENLRTNPVLRNRVFCRFCNFTGDVPENQILKFALYLVSKMPVDDISLHRKAMHLIHYMEAVTLSILDPKNLPIVKFSRLNEHYRRCVVLGQLLIGHCTLNLDTSGDIKYSSFLVSMDVLFQRFLYTYLRSKLKGYAVKEEPEVSAFDEERTALKMVYPDIVIRKSGRDILVIDAKYKRTVDEEGIRKSAEMQDIYEVFYYAKRLKLPVGILAYPKQEVLQDCPETHRVQDVTLLTRTIDLSKGGEEFIRECDRFVDSICSVIDSVVMPAILINSS
jgi:5-methylcytosine-specific restriction enzyme subunit McrC